MIGISQSLNVKVNLIATFNDLLISLNCSNELATLK